MRWLVLIAVAAECDGYMVGPDALPKDAAVPDSGAADAGGPADSGPLRDAGAHDAGVPDAGGAPDAGRPDAGPYLQPSPLISRGKPIMGSDSDVTLLNDGYYLDEGPGFWHADAPCWAAINVGAGPTRVLVSFDTHTPEWDYVADGAPRDYELLVSPDGVTFTSALKITGNPWARRAHAIDFTGQSWVKLVVTATNASDGHTGDLGELDVFDASKGTDDTWMFVGGGNYRFAFDKSVTHAPSYADVVHAKHAAYWPAMIEAGVSGRWLASDGAAQIDAWLDAEPEFQHWVLNYGTNDAMSGYETDITQFKADMQQLIDKVKARGKIPVLPNIGFMTSDQYPTYAAYNQAIAELNAANALLPGPDLVPYFTTHPDQLCQPDECEMDPAAIGAQPDDVGMAALNGLWAQAMDALYAP